MEVSEHEWENIGIESVQYFQGRGTAFSGWGAVFVGVGCDTREAIVDARENAATSGWNISCIKNPRWKNIRVTKHYDEECYYHVALYLKGV